MATSYTDGNIIADSFIATINDTDDVKGFTLVVSVDGEGLNDMSGSWFEEDSPGVKPSFGKGNYFMYWTGLAWLIEGTDGEYFSSTEDVAYPWLVDVWSAEAQGVGLGRPVFTDFQYGQVSVVVNNLTLSPAVVAVERSNEKGQLDAKLIKQDLNRWTGSAEVQIPTSTENIKYQYQKIDIPATESFTGTSLVALVDEESSPITVNESRIKTITIRAIKPNAIVVEGAGYARINGVYLITNDRNGHPQYATSDSRVIFWDDFDEWSHIDADGFITILSDEDVASIGLVTDWSEYTGTPPAPTVRQSTVLDHL